MDGTGNSLITAFDYVWGRLTDRLGGLTDEEYFWEPVPGCWSLRIRNRLRTSFHVSAARRAAGHYRGAQPAGSEGH